MARAVGESGARWGSGVRWFTCSTGLGNGAIYRKQCAADAADQKGSTLYWRTTSLLSNERRLLFYAIFACMIKYTNLFGVFSINCDLSMDFFLLKSYLLVRNIEYLDLFSASVIRFH